MHIYKLIIDDDTCWQFDRTWDLFIFILLLFSFFSNCILILKLFTQFMNIFQYLDIYNLFKKNLSFTVCLNYHFGNACYDILAGVELISPNLYARIIM